MANEISLINVYGRKTPFQLKRIVAVKLYGKYSSCVIV